MSIVVAELETLLTADAANAYSTMEKLGSDINAFAARDFNDAKVDLDTSAAEAKIKQLREGLEAFQREAAQAVRMAAANTTQGGVAAVGGRGSTAKPEKIAATTAATVEQLTKTTEARASASAQKIAAISSEAAARAEATQIQAETRTQAQIASIREQSEARSLANTQRAVDAIDAVRARSATRVEAIEAEADARRGTREAAGQQRLTQIQAEAQSRMQAAAVAAAARQEQQLENIQATGAARRQQASLTAEDRTAQAVERTATVNEQRRLDRLAQIQAEWELRQQLKSEQAARKAASGPSGLQKSARSLRYNGQEDVQTGAMLSAMVTAPLLAAGGAALKIGVDWEDAFTGVSKTVDATDEQLKALSLTLRDMAAGKKAIPITVEELDSVAEAAGQLGIQTPKIAAFTRVMADMGQTTNLTSAQAADEMARFANILQMSQDDFDRLGSTYVDLGNKTAATESEISAMALRLAGAGHQVGMSAADIASYGAALASVGIEAEAGGTAFSRVFINMGDAVRKGGKELNVYAKVAGVSAKEFQRAFKEDAAQAAAQFITGLGRMQQAGGNVTGTLSALHLGEIRVRDALLRAAGSGDLFTRALQIGNQAWKDNTALTTEAEKKYSTTAAQLRILTNRLREQGEQVAEKVLPTINSLIRSYGDSLPHAIGGTAEAFSALPGPLQEAVIGLTGLVALAGPAKLAAGNIELLRSALAGVGAAAMANPVSAAAALVIAAGGYLVLSDTFRKIAAAEEESRQATDDLNAALGRISDVLPSGSKWAGEIRKLRDEIAAAGDDTGKLAEAARDLNNLRSRINIEVKSNDLKLVMSSELDNAQRLLDRKQLVATVLVKPIYQQVEETVTQGLRITKPDRPLYDMTGRMNNVVDFLQGWGWNGEGGDDYDLFGDEYYDASHARVRGSRATRAAKERMAADQKRAGDLPRVFTVPTLDQVVGPEEAARQRLLAAKNKSAEPSATSGPAFAGTDPADDKAAKKARAAQERAEKALHRAQELQRTRMAQDLEESAKPWQNLDGIIDGVATRISEFDAKTEGARIRARLLRGEFEGLPKPILEAVGQMARLTDEMETAGKARDALRETNASTLSQLLRGGANITPFLASVRAQEAAHNYGGQIDTLRSRAAALALITGTVASNEAKSRTNQAQDLRDANDADNLAPLKGQKPAYLQTFYSNLNRTTSDITGAAFDCGKSISWALKKAGYDVKASAVAATNNVKPDAQGHYPQGTVLHLRAGGRGTTRHYGMAGDVRPDGRQEFVESTADVGNMNAAGYRIRNSRTVEEIASRIIGAGLPAGVNRAVSTAVNAAPARRGVSGNSLQTVAPDTMSGLTPLHDKNGPSSNALLPFSEKQLQEFLRAWGPVVTENNIRPGESRQYRLDKQDELLQRLATGEKLTPAQIRSERRSANVADDASARAAATTALTKAVREATTADSQQLQVLQEAKAAYAAAGGSMAAYERQAYLTQKRIEIWGSEHIKALFAQKRFKEANQAAGAEMKSAAAVYDADKGGERDRAATERAQQLADETAQLVEQRALLARSAGQPESEIARGLEEISRRYAEYRRLINEEGKDPAVAMQLATEYAAQLRVNDAAREALDIRKQLNQAATKAADDLAASRDEAELTAAGVGKGNRERELARRAAIRAKYRQTEGAVASGQMSWEEAAAAMAQASNDATAQYDASAANRKTNGAADLAAAHRDRMGLLQGEHDVASSGRPGSPEMQLQIRLLEKRYELEAQNRELADAEKFDVDERLRQYAEEIRAEDELSRFQESRRNLSDAVEHTLQLQKEHELIMANTAAERLAIEQKYQNLLAARHGIEVSPAEKDEQSKHRNLEASNEALSQWRSGASQFRDMVADSMENGTTSGFLRALKSAAFRRLATTITNGLLGANLGNDGDIFGVFKGKPKTLAADVKTPGVAQSSTSGAPTKLSSIVEQTRGRNRLQLAPEIAASILPKSLRRAAQGEGGVGSGESLNLENATFNIQNATEYVQTATINTSGTRAGGSSGSAGSGPSNEQMAGKIFGLFT